MRRLLAGALMVGALLNLPTPSVSAGSSLGALRRVFSSNLNASGGANGAYVVDLATGKVLYAFRHTIARLPASVEKLYTTATALLRFGAGQRLQTTIDGIGSVDVHGSFHGALYLHGGGDPTFGSRRFDSHAYGTGATIQQLAAKLVQRLGITSVKGRVIGDESLFDTLRGTAPYGYRTAIDIGGPLSGLEYDRGLADEQGAALQEQPALFAAQQLVLALRSAGVRIPPGSFGSGRAPARARALAAVGSPTVANLIRMTNAPSDNLFAELLLKGIGARFGAAGSSAAGAAVVRAQLARFGVHPILQDGSGLSRGDSTSPLQVVKVLERMAVERYFVHSLAVAGETGTLAARMNGSPADGRCQAKTGTLHDASALAGYCLARDGHTLAFAILQNQVDPYAARPLQDAMANALASYDG